MGYMGPSLGCAITDNGYLKAVSPLCTLGTRDRTLGLPVTGDVPGTPGGISSRVLYPPDTAVAGKSPGRVRALGGYRRREIVASPPPSGCCVLP